ncbi:MAG TPA: pyridoxal-phosphate dependent enzyme [Actinocrinis sp.]|uniref:threonine ammonia-lyase n=1 Tax=Actinocrinis sp. TaxID=1920516 RepID=UPI002DDC99DC|nr:pyridoxal-phosphate dependent enzyme [Actinocrinis sp.]HEV2346733.1 pyridoxal-phosphate dependent enzyme [Actinocrinis sp.]
MATTSTVTLDDVLAARKLLADIVRHTPLAWSRPLSEQIGGEVWFKCENLQRAGSFKIRGAYVRIHNLPPHERARGVVAASAGNHAQGVALAATLHGIQSTVFMPDGAPLPKIAATESYGAQVRFHGSTVDDALVAAKRFSQETGAALIHPFDHADIIAGQGTVALEILDQCPQVKTVLVAAGGGGLLAGIGTVMHALRPEVRVVGVQAATAAAYPASLTAGTPTRIANMATMADGIAVGCPGDVPFGIIRELGTEILTVSEESISQASLLLLERNKLVVEPAGAVGVAALLEAVSAGSGSVGAGPIKAGSAGAVLVDAGLSDAVLAHTAVSDAALPEFEPPIVAVLSGGNVDPLLLLRLIRHGLASAGRFLSLRLRLTDRPGALAQLLAALAAVDANVVDVEHGRTSAGLGVGEVEVAVTLETRGADHAAAVLSRLTEAGYAPSVQ